jgi:hypothetical protein
LVMKKLTGFSNTSEKSANNLVQAQK